MWCDVLCDVSLGKSNWCLCEYVCIHVCMHFVWLSLDSIQNDNGAGIAQWLECQTRDWKVTGSNPCRSSRKSFFSRVNFLCWLLFRYPFHPYVTAVARKRSWSFCQKCRWQVTAKHAYTLHIWLCMKWHGAWLYGVHTNLHQDGDSFMWHQPCQRLSTPLQWIFKKSAIKS